jgi:dipeptidyl aminopeptidase/acylaminoacyl peptidase
MALLFAAHEPRLAGCVAFAPAVDVEKRLGGIAIGIISLLRPNIKKELALYSPKHNETRIGCPVFLFHAQDDHNVPIAESRGLAARLKAAGKRVTIRTVPSGDHYDSMISQGIAKAIAWVRSLPSEKTAVAGP